MERGALMVQTCCWVVVALLLLACCHDVRAAAGKGPEQLRAEWQVARRVQELFCAHVHPLDLKDMSKGKLRDGGEIYVRSVSDTVSSHVLSQAQGWEPQELSEIEWAMKAPLPEGRASKGPPLFVDGGANVGWFTLNLAALGYEVAAFEALRHNQLLIRTSLCANPKLQQHVTLFDIALGAKAEDCFMFSHVANTGNGMAVCGVQTVQEAQAKAPDAQFQLRGPMRMQRLDNLLLPRLTRLEQDIKVFKLDVEGYEPFVLEGASALMAQRCVWFLGTEYNAEMLDMRLKPQGKTTLDFFKQLQGLGYRISSKSFRGPFLTDAEMEELSKKRMPPGSSSDQQFYLLLFCVHRDYPDALLQQAQAQ